MDLDIEANVEEFMAEIAADDATLVRGIRDAVATACRAGENEARSNHRWKSRTGELEAGIQGRQISSGERGAEGELVSLSPHSGFVNDGTPAHAIYPKDKKALAFEAGGTKVFASVVHHPGTAPDPFFERGIAKAEEVLVREVEATMDKITNG